MFVSFGNGEYNIITHNHAVTGDVRKYYDLQKRLNFSLLSLFNLFSTFYSMAANEGHKKPNVNLQSRSLKGKVRAKIISPFMH